MMIDRRSGSCSSVVGRRPTSVNSVPGSVGSRLLSGRAVVVVFATVPLSLTLSPLGHHDLACPETRRLNLSPSRRCGLGTHLKGLARSRITQVLLVNARNRHSHPRRNPRSHSANSNGRVQGDLKSSPRWPNRMGSPLERRVPALAAAVAGAPTPTSLTSTQMPTLV
jgi:hypothetical protein